jgi:hypothetical protein
MSPSSTFSSCVFVVEVPGIGSKAALEESSEAGASVDAAISPSIPPYLQLAYIYG